MENHLKVKILQDEGPIIQVSLELTTLGHRVLSSLGTFHFPLGQLVLSTNTRLCRVHWEEYREGRDPLFISIPRGISWTSLRRKEFDCLLLAAHEFNFMVEYRGVIPTSIEDEYFHRISGSPELPRDPLLGLLL